MPSVAETAQITTETLKRMSELCGICGIMKCTQVVESRRPSTVTLLPMGSSKGTPYYHMILMVLWY